MKIEDAVNIFSGLIDEFYATCDDPENSEEYKEMNRAEMTLLILAQKLKAIGITKLEHTDKLYKTQGGI